MKWLSRYEQPAYAALRIVAGFMMSFHGVQKLFGVLGGEKEPVLSQLWIGGVIELVGGVLVCIGLFTRIAAFILSGTMAVAYFQFHWKLEFADFHFLPVVNHGDGAVLYCFVFLLIACRGHGRWAIDSRDR